MAAFLQILIAVLAAWSAWWLIRKLLRPRSPAEPEPVDDTLALVPASRKHGPKGQAGAVALEEPDDDDPVDCFPPRSL